MMIDSTATRTPTEPPPLGRALGRVPSGIYILTVRADRRETGMLVSWVQQAGFDPPLLTIALRRDRYVSDWIAASGRFTLSQVAAGQKHLLRHFAHGFAPDEPAFEGIALDPTREAAGGPVLSEALAYLDAEVVDHLDGSDHRIYLARIVGGAVLNAEEHPMVHVRRNGFHY